MLVLAPALPHIDFLLRCYLSLILPLFIIPSGSCVKADSLTAAETLKNNLYQSDYNQLGMVLVCDSFGKQGPDLLRYQWTVADTTAQRIVSVPTHSLPAALALVPSFADHAAPQIQTFTHLRQIFVASLPKRF